MELLFDAKDISRSTTRQEWRAINRWRRVVQKRVREETARYVENIMTYGTSHPDVAAHFMDQIINPPLVVFP